MAAPVMKQASNQLVCSFRFGIRDQLCMSFVLAYERKTFIITSPETCVWKNHNNKADNLEYSFYINTIKKMQL